MKTEKIFILNQISTLLNITKHATENLLQLQNISESEKLLELATNGIIDLATKYFEKEEA